jgi:3-oxoacyl-[acyl-carrier protein] reductase/pteridine reductase
MNSTNSLSGQVVLVTGGGRRIGRAIALRLAEAGARVAIHYHRSAEEAAEVARLCGGQIFGADLTQVPQIQRLFEQVGQTYGRLDGLVNNAARFRPMPALEVTEEDWDWIHQVNLKATFFCCQAGARLMLKNGGGRIVNISSLGGLRPWSKHVPYGASKAGVIMMTRGLAKALAPKITVNSVAPGVIQFEEQIPAEIQHLISVTPMKRHGAAREVAEAVLGFLTGPSFITGQILAVDGGLSLRA